MNFDAIDLELVVPQEGKLDRYVIYFSISNNNKIIAKTKMVIPSTNRLNTIRFTKGLLKSYDIKRALLKRQVFQGRIRYWSRKVSLKSSYNLKIIEDERHEINCK
ncbi:MAG: hypothetical protein ABJB85_07955 [Nitrososphaerota archaeon]